MSADKYYEIDDGSITEAYTIEGKKVREIVYELSDVSLGVIRQSYRELRRDLQSVPMTVSQRRQTDQLFEQISKLFYR